MVLIYPFPISGSCVTHHLPSCSFIDGLCACFMDSSSYSPSLSLLSSIKSICSLSLIVCHFPVNYFCDFSFFYFHHNSTTTGPDDHVVLVYLKWVSTETSLAYVIMFHKPITITIMYMSLSLYI